MTDTTTAPSPNGTTVTPNAWTIEWMGHTWRSTETVTQQICAVAELLGVWNWEASRPDAGPRQLVVWIAVLWSSTEAELPVEEAVRLVMGQPLAVVVDALTTGD